MFAINYINIFNLINRCWFKNLLWACSFKLFKMLLATRFKKILPRKQRARQNLVKDKVESETLKKNLKYKCEPIDLESMDVEVWHFKFITILRLISSKTRWKDETVTLLSLIHVTKVVIKACWSNSIQNLQSLTDRLNVYVWDE